LRKLIYGLKDVEINGVKFVTNGWLDLS